MYIPVKCVLQWAFVDDQLAQTLTQVKADLQSQAPWSYILAGPTAVHDLISGWQNPGADCGGDNVTDDRLGLPLGTLKPWCALSSGAGQGIFTVATMRTVALGGVALSFLWACYHRAKRLMGESGPNDPSQNVVAGDDSAGYSPEDDIDAYNGYRTFE